MRFVAALLLVVLLALVSAQSPPNVHLVAAEALYPGDTVRIEATGLRDVTHQLLVRPPAGVERTLTVEPVVGRLSLPLEVTAVGVYEVRLTGPDVTANFTLDVLSPITTGPPTDEAPAAPPTAVVPELTLEENTLSVYEPNGLLRWRWSAPLTSGTSTFALAHLGRIWLAHGHQLLLFNPDDGTVLDRVATHGIIVDLQPDENGMGVSSRVHAPGADLITQARYQQGSLQPTALFDPFETSLYLALEREASVPDPRERRDRDRTNPYLHLHVALHALTELERETAVAAALASLRTFYDAAQLARAFVEQGWWGAAEEAMVLALADFTARGYRAGLLTDPAVHERYGFPLQPLEMALLQEDLRAIEFWAAWLYPLSGADLPGVGVLLRRVANYLALQGERDAAALWRQRAAARTNPEVAEVLARNAVVIGRGSVMASAALMLALLALHLTLTVKYRRAQDLTAARARARGVRRWRWPMLRTIRYYGTTEKMVLVLILAGAYATIVLAGWVERSDAVVAFTAAGHLELPTTTALLAGANGDPVSVAAVTAYREGRSNQPPSPTTLRAAVADRWSAAIAIAFRAPWSLLDDHQRPLGLPTWSWPAQLLLFWGVAAWHLLWLPIPRPRYAVDAPRPLGYQLLALLIPGSGQADELYGILMLIPWAIFGIDGLLQMSGFASPLGIPMEAAGAVLAVLYALNTIAWAIEFGSVSRRQRELVARNPELAHEYGSARNHPPTPEPTV